MFFVHRNRRLVIDKHRQLNAVNAQPVIAHINHGAHQCAGNALVLPLRAYTNPKISHMAAAWALRDSDAQMPGDITIYTGDQLLNAGLVGESFLPHLLRRMRNL